MVINQNRTNSRRLFISNFGLLAAGLVLSDRLNALSAGKIFGNSLEGQWQALCHRLKALETNQTFLPVSGYLSPVAGQLFTAGRTVAITLNGGDYFVARPVWIEWPRVSVGPADLLVQVFTKDGQPVATLNRYEVEFISRLPDADLPGFLKEYLRAIPAGQSMLKSNLITRISANSKAKTLMPSAITV